MSLSLPLRRVPPRPLRRDPLPLLLPWRSLTSVNNELLHFSLTPRSEGRSDRYERKWLELLQPTKRLTQWASGPNLCFRYPPLLWLTSCRNRPPVYMLGSTSAQSSRLIKQVPSFSPLSVGSDTHRAHSNRSILKSFPSCLISRILSLISSSGKDRNKAAEMQAKSQLRESECTCLL